LLRVGWSVDFSHSQLGEDEFSYGFDGRGLKVENGKFEEFGESFGENDVIGCFADFEGAELVELSFSKNGQELGAAFRVPKEALGPRALLPHVLCKGCAVELNFGQRPEPLAPVPEGFVFIHEIPAPERVRTPTGPKTTEECEVLLMPPLPGSGKTQWAQKHSQENRDKRYNILGTERVLHQLRTRAPPPEELDAKSPPLLTQQAAQCPPKLVQIAPRAPPNFILDQVPPPHPGKRRETGRETPAEIRGNSPPKIPQKSLFPPRPDIPGEPNPPENQPRNLGSPPQKSRITSPPPPEKSGITIHPP
ncbi:HNRL2 protein, partial [Locustella ochotensis]|nr:HNRL2 protein [Locustella ochotensis]